MNYNILPLKGFKVVPPNEFAVACLSEICSVQVGSGHHNEPKERVMLVAMSLAVYILQSAGTIE